MKTILYGMALLAVLGAASCSKKFEELQENPNIPTSVPPDLVLNRVLNSLSSGLGGVEPWGAVARYNQYYCRNYQYYGDNQYNWNNGPFDVYLNVLKNVTQMELEASRSSGRNNTPYHAIAKFLKAYYYYNLTSLMGDVPMSQAIQAQDAVLQPKYDTQKEIFLQIIQWLDGANADFNALKQENDRTLKGDFFYNGDYTKWRKLANSFKLRVLTALSKKDADADLKIKTRFAGVMNDLTGNPIFESVADNLAYKYISGVNNYPTNPVNYGFDALRYNMAETYVKSCTNISDPRVLVTCEPAWKLVNDNGWAPSDFRAFKGSPTGQAQDQMENDALSYKVSLINRYRYYRSNTAEDFTIAGYAEMCFNIAEAIHRGWTAGNAEDWYKKGIQASLSFFGIADGVNTGRYLPVGQSLGNYITSNFSFNFNTWYATAGVQYEAGTAGLNKILLQKYIAGFQNSCWEGYYNFRRTGQPDFSGGVGIGNNGAIPKRWTYPSSELNRNAANLQEALNRQFSGQDNINGEMWLIKN